ncbi:MAG: hypothetical protein KJ718_01525 [Nanoarchaeota archaeon]|nr:hypothetical protein [Nanoarchaeota archaeon]
MPQFIPQLKQRDFLRDFKKGKQAKKKVESAVRSVWLDLGAIICYVCGALLLLFGIIFLGILFLALTKGNISDLGSLTVSGSCVFLIVLGIGIIFLGRYLSKKK